MLLLEAGFEFAFATARTFVFRGFEATARAVLRSVDYMSLMLFYMANSFHLARTPKLRLAHLKQPTPTLSPKPRGRVEIWRGSTEVLRFQIPLIKPGMPISGTRLSDKGVS